MVGGEVVAHSLGCGGGSSWSSRGGHVVWPAPGADKDDELLGGSGHRDGAVDRSIDALAKRLWVDEDDQVELEPHDQLRGSATGRGTSPRTWGRREGAVMRVEPLRVHVAQDDPVADLDGDDQFRCGPAGTSRMLARKVAEAPLAAGRDDDAVQLDAHGPSLRRRPSRRIGRRLI